MQLRLLALPLLLAACIPPKEPGESASASDAASTHDASDSAGDGQSETGGPDEQPTTGPVMTTSATSTDPDSGTTLVESVTTSSASDPEETTNPTTPTSVSDTSTTMPPETESDGEPVVDLGTLQVHTLGAENGGGGLDGIKVFAADPNLPCPEDPPPQCPGAPSLGEPQLVVDGALAGPDAISLGSRVALLFPYDQPACALGCGRASLLFELGNGDGFAGENSLPLDLPCATADSDVWLAFDFGKVVNDFSHKVELRLVDPCGAKSPTSGLTFTPQ